MSTIVNTGHVRPGCIYRMALENFVTYKQVELYPGLSLNMIIGPNGTGKSTFVCAIILGLCGNINIIGRAKKISEYVRSGCEQSSIEIELYQQPGQKNVIIKRVFNLNDLTTWYIDNLTVSKRKVEELIAKLHIQVDNLCQLLPQDRVQDFAKMDPQQLLRSTLAAVGGEDSVTQLNELISMRVEQRGLSTDLQNNAEQLQEQIRLNERLKVIIDAMKQCKEIEQQIDICEKKRLWLEYQDLKDKVTEYTNDKKKALKVVGTHKTKMKALESVMEKAKERVRSLEQKKLSANREVYTLKDKAKEILGSVRSEEYRIIDIEASYQQKLDTYKNRQQELMEAKAKLDKLVTDKAGLIKNVGDETHVKMELAELHKQISGKNATINMLKKENLEIQFDLENNVMPQIRLYQNKIRALENVGEKRLEVLKQYSEDTYKAIVWLRENRKLFQCPVYEPMMLEIKFTDPKFARYLESTVAARDLVAFTFESVQDMNLFMERTKQGLGLNRVNAVHSPSYSLQKHQTNIQQLSYLGFYTYMLDTISAPDAIIRYLCKHYAIDRIPIGNEHTFNNSKKVPANITHFFTENHRFAVSVSAYSGQRSSSITEIRPARLLANTLDVEELNNYNIQLSNMEQTSQSHKKKTQEVNNKISALENILNQLNTRRKTINEGVEKVRMICTLIRLQNNKIADLENEPSLDLQREKETCVNKQKQCVIKQCTLHRELKDVIKSLHGKLLKGEMMKVNLNLSRNAVVQQDAELREVRKELMSVQATLDSVENLLARALSNAKEKLKEAKRTCNNKLPQDPDFPYKREFKALPSDLTALQAHCMELQARVACMDSGDEQVIREYEKRERTISTLKSNINNSSDINKQLDAKMSQIRSQWLPRLENLIRSIDRAFGDMFAKMGCAGEIQLDKAGADEDYDKYGVGIMVRFRNEEPLARLTRHAQSGGERALCTALYLCALQTLTAAPFRCVDEINQGMDPINERKMFQLLVKVTTECDNSQYFLLTPKLLTDLEYNSKITVHTIMNGKQIMNYKVWNYHKFLQKSNSF